MQAINAAICPKIDQNNFAFQMSINANGVRVEPDVIGWKIRHFECLFISCGELLLLTDKLSYSFQISLSENIIAIPILLQHLD